MLATRITTLVHQHHPCTPHVSSHVLPAGHVWPDRVARSSGSTTRAARRSNGLKKVTGDALDAAVVPSVPGEQGGPATERPGLPHCSAVWTKVQRDLSSDVRQITSMVSRTSCPTVSVSRQKGPDPAEAGVWAEEHVAYGNGGAILPPVGLSGTHNGRVGVAGLGAASDCLSKAHVRMLSDDPSLPTSFDRHDSFPARSIPRRAETLRSQRA